MANTAEQLSAISQEFQQARLEARRNFASASLGGNSGIRRDRAEAKARRVYKAKLAKISPTIALRVR